MRTIWKFPLEIGETTVEMPNASLVLSVQVQQGSLALWAEVDPGQSRVRRRFTVYGTGHSMPENPGRYLCTFQAHDGKFVGHVYEN